MIKVGFIGLGKMGVSHLSILNENPNVKVVGTSDTSKFVIKSFNKLTEFEVYEDYKKMIDAALPDAIVISTPSSIHYEIAKYVIEKGLNVFIEKPLSLCYKESKELTGLSKDKVITQVGYHNRFISTFKFAKEVITKGCLGEVYNFRAEAHGPAITKPSNSWRTSSPVGGGCLYDYGSHVINLLSFIIGTPDKVDYAVLKKIHSNNVDDFVSANLSYNDGKKGYLELNWSDESCRRMTTEITIWGSKGKLYANSQEVHLFIKEEFSSLQLKKGWNIKYITDFTNEVSFFVRGEEYSAQLDYFIDKITNKDFNNINSFEEASKTDLLIEKINSIREA